LVLIQDWSSTIQTSSGGVLHSFSKTRQFIALELQGCGHITDIHRPETFKQDADDVAALLKYLKIEYADFFGFSNARIITMQIAIRYPNLVWKIILDSVFFKRDWMYQQFWGSSNHSALNDMPQLLKVAYKKVAPDPNDLSKMYEKVKKDGLV
jgi:pimeloyl-ACP methyl ester carboxylesterase